MAQVLSFSLDDHPSLGGLIEGQGIELKLSGSILHMTDRVVTFNVNSIIVSKRSKLSTNEIVQQLAKIRQSMPTVESHP